MWYLVVNWWYKWVCNFSTLYATLFWLQLMSMEADYHMDWVEFWLAHLNDGRIVFVDIGSRGFTILGPALPHIYMWQRLNLVLQLVCTIGVYTAWRMVPVNKVRCICSISECWTNSSFFHAIHVYRFDQSTRIIKRNLTHSSRGWIMSSGIFSLDNEFWDIQFGSW